MPIASYGLTYYSSDYEGALSSFSVLDPLAPAPFFVSLESASTSADLHLNAQGQLVLADGVSYIFGGDLFDRGRDDQRLLTLLLDAKERYGDRVTLIGGNRDYNKLRWPLELMRQPQMSVEQLLKANGVNDVATHWTQGDESQRQALIDWLLSDEMERYLAHTVIAHYDEASDTLIHHGDFDLRAFAHIPDQGVDAIDSTIEQFESEPARLKQHVEQLNAWKHRAFDQAMQYIEPLREIAARQAADEPLDAEQLLFLHADQRNYPDLALYAGVAPLPNNTDGAWPTRWHLDVPQWVDDHLTLASPPRVKEKNDNSRAINDRDGMTLLQRAGVKHVLVGHTPQGHLPTPFHRHTSSDSNSGVWFVFADTSYAVDAKLKIERRPVVLLKDDSLQMTSVMNVPELTAPLHLYFGSDSQHPAVGKLIEVDGERFNVIGQQRNGDFILTRKRGRTLLYRVKPWQIIADAPWLEPIAE